MKGIEYIPTRDNIYFLCYLVELLCRDSKNKKSYIVGKMDRDYVLNICKHESAYHSMNFDQLIKEEKEELGIERGRFFREERASFRIPTIDSFGRLYRDIILKLDGDVIDNFFKVMNSPIADLIDDFNSSLYYDNVDYLVACVEEGEIVDEYM